MKFTHIFKFIIEYRIISYIPLISTNSLKHSVSYCYKTDSCTLLHDNKRKTQLMDKCAKVETTIMSHHQEPDWLISYILC